VGGFMRTFRLLFLFALALCPAAVVAAQEREHPIDKTLRACEEQDPSTAGQVRCITAAQGMWDKELNRVYNELARRLAAPARQRLRAAQLAWISHRDAEFKLIDEVYANLEGTMYVPMQAHARMRVVKARALELAGYLSLLEEHRR
ncbi:MAG TPA: lysozyme inhibitor LprI family protein, partial [Pyrinomonadaceae bacterium]|nr:lysozyme inhibitor LprI family protein [Pyrinomonadaceae bacterium]